MSLSDEKYQYDLKHSYCYILQEMLRGQQYNCRRNLASKANGILVTGETKLNYRRLSLMFANLKGRLEN